MVPRMSNGSGYGADCFQANGNGFSIYNCIITGYPAAYLGGQHQDGEQFLGNSSNVAIYNNTITDMANSCIYGDGYAGGFTNVMVYNNVCQVTDPLIASGSPGGIIFGSDAGFVGTPPCVFTNIVISNNIIVDLHANNAAVALNNVNGILTTFSGCIIANNAMVNCGNVNVTGNSTTTVETNATISKGNAPNSFVSYIEFGGSSNNLQYSATDASLVDLGTDLSAISSLLATDRLGIARPQGPSWDIGPYEQIPPTHPVIVLNPSPAVNPRPPGSTVTYSALGRGLPTLTFKWQKNGVDVSNGGNVSGATTSTLTLSSVSTADNGTYTFIATNGSGFATSTGSALTVTNQAFITIQPASQSVPIGGTAIFVSAAAGIPTPTFQWEKNGVNMSDGGNVSGSTTNTLTLTNVSASDSATYTLHVVNTLGSDTSMGAVLTIIDIAPLFTVQPQSQTVSTGNLVTFAVAATGTPTPTYQWQVNGANITDGGIFSGSTTATLNLTGVSPSNDGVYSVIATNAGGATNSQGATLVVNNPYISPTISQISNQTALSGSNVTFSVATSGNPAPSIQWYWAGAPIAGATSASLTLTGVSTANSGNYYATATNIAGTSTTNVATLIVQIPSRIVNMSIRRSLEWAHRL